MLAGDSSRRHVSAAVGAALAPGSRPAASDCGSHAHQRGRGVVSSPAELIPRCGHSVSATSTYRLPQTGHADYGQARQAHGDARLSLPALPESGVICDRRAGRDDDYPGHELHVLGFDFRRAPVRRRDRRDRRDGVQMCGLVPLVGKAARKSMARTIRQRNRGRRTNLGFRGPATVVDPRRARLDQLRRALLQVRVDEFPRTADQSIPREIDGAKSTNGCRAKWKRVGGSPRLPAADRPIANTFEYAHASHLFAIAI
ncbi:hypothetical protein C8E95_7054 [Pseudonocardia autotrophica]|uniref:Uncharacterized protein n=1 Tax=Pseudonocardia autotrophica TaxID=2074 RepID=A0A1Y2MH57_PSEAH|nr:hypothetical protein BG845_06696 [Pseudonocardia autotrophica]TDN65559.1 hypothetical protein C8E95_7054 [Pseudonocardia autotrophica]